MRSTGNWSPVLTERKVVFALAAASGISGCFWSFLQFIHVCWNVPGHQICGRGSQRRVLLTAMIGCADMTNIEAQRGLVASVYECICFSLSPKLTLNTCKSQDVKGYIILLVETSPIPSVCVWLNAQTGTESYTHQHRTCSFSFTQKEPKLIKPQNDD